MKDYWFKEYNDMAWINRDARSSPFVRIVNGKPQRYNPSPELDKLEAKIGKQEEHGVFITQ